MTLPTTEMLSEGEPIDARSTLDAAEFMLDGQRAALDAVRVASADIARAAQIIAEVVRGGNTIHYAAAGSSGLMALADASELAGTFGIPASKVKIHMAGGVPVDAIMPGDTEDDAAAGRAVEAAVVPGDAMVVLTASGSTPYALEVASMAKAKGATIIGIANNPATPLLDVADVPICLETPPEVVAGSTRLGAGTAQKAALNLMSTLMGVELGHVYQGMMVNVVADNAKLIARSAGIVANIAEVSRSEAETAIARANGQTKSAILVAAGASLSRAQGLLAEHQGHLGPCFQSINSNQDANV